MWSFPSFGLPPGFLHSIATAPLCHVERRIGLGWEIVQAGTCFGTPCHPKGRAQGPLPATPIPGSRPKLKPDSLRNPGTEIQTRIGEPDGEFFSAYPARNIGVANLFANNASKMNQRRIACRMSERIVEVFEPVEIGIDERALLRGNEPECFVEPPAIVKSCERIDRGRTPLLIGQKCAVYPRRSVRQGFVELRSSGPHWFAAAGEPDGDSANRVVVPFHRKEQHRARAIAPVRHHPTEWLPV